MGHPSNQSAAHLLPPARLRQGAALASRRQVGAMEGHPQLFKDGNHRLEVAGVQKVLEYFCPLSLPQFKHFGEGSSRISVQCI